MLTEGKYTYRDMEFEEVPTQKDTCEGCIFEFQVIGRDCGQITKPECKALLRHDGTGVIFRYKEPKPDKNGRHTGTGEKPRAGRRGKA